MTDEWNTMKAEQYHNQSYQLIKNFITVWVMLFTGRQTRWDVLTWDVLTLGRFDLGCFDLGRFDSGTFWLWDALTWDVLTLGHFDLGRFNSGTFWLGTFWLWDILTWDVLTLGQEMFAISSLIKYSEKILGRFWLTKNGTFWQIAWGVLTGYQLCTLKLNWHITILEGIMKSVCMYLCKCF